MMCDLEAVQGLLVPSESQLGSDEPELVDAFTDVLVRRADLDRDLDLDLQRAGVVQVGLSIVAHREALSADDAVLSRCYISVLLL